MDAKTTCQRILVLEDKPSWQRTLKNVLSTAGYDVTVCGSVEEAKQVLRQKAFRIASVDISMVQGNWRDEGGIELLKEIKDRYREDPMHAIVVTAYGTSQRVRDAFKEYDVFDYVEKSGDSEDEDLHDKLLQAIGEALTKAAKSRPRYLGGHKAQVDAVCERIAQILNTDLAPASAIKLQVEYTVADLVEKNALHPVVFPAVWPDLPQTEGWCAILPCWSRGQAKMILLQVGLGDLPNPKHQPWVKDRGWDLAALDCRGTSLNLTAAGFTLNGLKYDEVFSSD